MQANTVQRLRITFAKTGSTRFIGHLDLVRTLERVFNRARIPLAYTQGYNKRPRIQLANALPLGYTSECELADIWLVDRLEPSAVQSRISERSAPGIEVNRVEEVPLPEPALQNRTIAATYRVTLKSEVDLTTLQKRIDALLSSSALPRERRGKAYDLRPLVLNLAIDQYGSDRLTVLNMRLSLLPGASGRPDEILKALEVDPLDTRIHRTELVLNDRTPST